MEKEARSEEFSCEEVYEVVIPVKFKIKTTTTVTPVVDESKVLTINGAQLTMVGEEITMP